MVWFCFAECLNRNRDMASCTTPPSLMLAHPQDLSSSLRFFSHSHSPLSRTFSFCPLVLKPSSKWVHFTFQRDPKSRTSHALVAALAAEVELPETVDDTAEGVEESGPVDTLTTAKPKKGKAALPLKRDRVCAVSFFSPFSFLNLVMSMEFWVRWLKYPFEQIACFVVSFPPFTICMFFFSFLFIIAFK